MTELAARKDKQADRQFTFVTVTMDTPQLESEVLCIMSSVSLMRSRECSYSGDVNDDAILEHGNEQSRSVTTSL